MTPVRLSGRRSALPVAVLAFTALLAVAFLAAPAVEAQLGPRTMGNAALRLDAGQVGDQLSISSSDSTTHKMEFIRHLQYMEPEKWRAASVTYLRFRHGENGEILVTEMGPGVVREVEAPKKWSVETTEGGGWKLTSEKAGGKLDLYLDTTFDGEPFKVGAVVPKFEGEAYGAVYRGMDFLFFVMQKKHPEPPAAG